jgi:alpha-L-fucosidase
MKIFARLTCATLVLLASTVSGGSQTPNGDDDLWRESTSKYAPQRQKKLAEVHQGATQGPFRPDWESLKKYEIPDWYRDAKFGIFIHWGVYSVPAFGSEWYARLMYMQGTPEFKHHVATYGPQNKFGYKDFIPRFHAEKFDPHAWAALFREAGAKYVIPVAEHHDGFPMYDSDLTDWCAKKMGPHRDVIGDLAQAIRAEGLHLGLSSHRAEHYFFFNGGRSFDSDVQDPKYASLYGPAHVGVKDPDWVGHPDPAYIEDWLARTAEIIDKYRPDLLYFDWWIGRPEFEASLRQFVSYYYNSASRRDLTPVLFYKEHAIPEGAAVWDVERGQLDRPRALAWQTDTSISDKSWGYIENDTYKSPESLIWQLVDIVSKNGNLLLNIGPRSDGTIPEQAENVLRQIGAWLRTNGEAIYGTRPWRFSGEGPTKVVGGAFHDTATQPFTAEDIRFTTKGKFVYAVALGWPKDAHLLIHSISPSNGLTVKEVQLLGSDAKIKWSQEADGLHLQLPAQAAGQYAYAFRLAGEQR